MNETIREYAKFTLGVLMVVAGTNYLHHLLMMTETGEVAWWMYVAHGSYTLIGLFIAFPKAMPEIANDIADAWSRTEGNSE